VVEQTAGFKVYSIDVSAIAAGIYSDRGDALISWTAPTKRMATVSGVHGLSITLDVPPQPQQGFDAHFVMENTGLEPIHISPNDCTLHENLTDGAGAGLTASQNCGEWMGPTNADGLLRPGERVTADLTIEGDEFTGQICHTGQWNVELTFETPTGAVHYAPVSFHVNTICSACCGR
jgi:hypothetical protein